MPEFNINFDPEDIDPPRPQFIREAPGQPTYELLTKLIKVVSEERPDGISATEVGAIVTHFLVQLRTFFTIEEMRFILPLLLGVAEQWTEQEDWINVMDGSRTSGPIVAEKVHANPDGREMMEELRKGMSEDELHRLLNGT